jgi:thioredoxin reductase
MVKCERQSIDTRALFVFIGAVPNTAWLAGTIELDDHGFSPTGPAALYSNGDGEKRRRPRRQPMMLETSQPGVFTAGDVRSGSVNSSRSPVSQAPTNAGSARAGLKLLPDAAVTESEAGGGAKPGLPLPMGQCPAVSRLPRSAAPLG